MAKMQLSAITFTLYNMVLHCFFILTRGYQLNPICPVIFEENTQTDAFGSYCKRMAFSLERIIPDRYRSDICYSKCQQSHACIYYGYDAFSMLCIVCLRPKWHFDNPKVGTDIVEYHEVPMSVFSRIGVEFDTNACSFLDYSCSTRWFGGNGGEYGELEIGDDQTISSVQFCTDRVTPDNFGGFRIMLDTGDSHTRGCRNAEYHALFEIAAEEFITQIKVYYGHQFVHGLWLTTDAENSVEEMGSQAGNGDDYCVIERGDLAAIETRHGAWIDAIRFHFHDC